MIVMFIKRYEMAAAYTIMLSILLLSSGCIVVGFDPKTEIRKHEERMDGFMEDTLTCAVIDVGKPVVSVSRQGDEGMTKIKICINVEAPLRFSQKDVVKKYCEKWEIEDGKALSFGILPGYGRLLCNRNSYARFSDGPPKEDKPPYVVELATHPLGACWMHLALGAPTLSSLLYAPFDNGISEWAQFGLLGCDHFPTDKPIGETMVSRESEIAISDSAVSESSSRQGLGCIVTATVEIPALWYRKTVAIPPRIIAGNIVSSATLDLPASTPPNITGVVSLSFVDESGKFGLLLKPYEGMTSKFAL